VAREKPFSVIIGLFVLNV